MEPATDTDTTSGITLFITPARDNKITVSKAKSMINDAATAVLENAIRLHGAIGITWDYDLGFHHRRVRADSLIFGNSGYHKRKITQLMEQQVVELGHILT